MSIPLLVLVGLLIGGWVIDERNHDGRVPRNVEFAGSNVSGANADQVTNVVAALNQRFASIPVEITAGDEVVSTSAGNLGMQLDAQRTIDQIMQVDANASPPQRFWRWLNRWRSPAQTEAVVILDSSRAAATVNGLAAGFATDASYPTIELRDGTFVGEAGTPGRQLDTDALLTGLESRIPTSPDGALRIEAELTESPAPLSDGGLEQYLGELNRLTAAPLQVLAGDALRNVPSDVLRSWLTIVPPDDGVSPPLTGIDPDAVDAWLRTEFPPPAIDIDPSRITVVGGVPRVAGSTVAACCDPAAPQTILEAVLGGTGRATVPLTDTDVNPLEAYGIVELVGEFTTYHPAGQDRVKNIQRMADLVRGAIVEPGDSFSINDHVGRRTPEKGFVEAGVIYRGVLDKDVGGGVSQFATTIFNAAFFAGLDFDEYQAHSIYFERYPYGREATISFPAPDLRIANTTPYPVLIWTSYSADSITVSLYSTSYAEVVESGAWTEVVGACTRALTERTRTFPDKDPQIDTVQALYQPKEGLDCAGLPTLPVPECPPTQKAVDTNDTGFADTCEPLSPGELAVLPGGDLIGCAIGQAGFDSDGNGVIDTCLSGANSDASDPCSPLVSIDTNGDGLIDSCGSAPGAATNEAQTAPD